MDIKERLDKLINDTKGTILSHEKIFDSGFIKIYKEEYKLPDGRVINKQRISKNDGKNAAIVITRTIDNKYLIVFQNRVNNNVSAEFPSGYIEPNEDGEYILSKNMWFYLDDKIEKVITITYNFIKEKN